MRVTPRLITSSTTYFLLFLCGFCTSGLAQKKVVEICKDPQATAHITGVSKAALDWGDFDNDGDPDLLIGGDWQLRVYRNDNGVFHDHGALLPGIIDGEVKWGDYDNDGFLDILNGGASPRVFRNNNLSFVDTGARFLNAEDGSADWGDFNDDGYLDILLTGDFKSRIYFNKVFSQTTPIFKEASSRFIGMAQSAADVGDYDNDGDLDIILSGNHEFDTWNGRTILYRNEDGRHFSPVIYWLGGNDGAVAFGDINNDGLLEIAMSGSQWGSTERRSNVYYNDGSTFFTIGNVHLFPNVNRGTISWADYDGDGDSDLFMAGELANNRLEANIFRTDGSTFFRDHAAGTAEYRNPASGWADYDGDGDPDLLLMGGGNVDLFRISTPANRAAPLRLQGLESDTESLPETFALQQNFPNPFNPSTTIRYHLAQKRHVTISIYNSLGQSITTLVDAVQPAGEHTVQWDGQFENGGQAYSGIYFYQMSTGEYQETQRMLLIR